MTEGGMGEATRPMPPALWAQTLSGTPVLDRKIGGVAPASVRRWFNVEPDIDQPALDHHYLSVHLGGAKRLCRRGEGAVATRDIVLGAHSIVPAGAAFRWETIGPIDFVHFYFAPKLVDHVVASAFDRDPAHVFVREALGDMDPMIHTLAINLIDELSHEGCQQAYLDDMLHLLLCRSLRLHSNVRNDTARARHALAPHRLKRALDFIEAHLAMPIGVSEIAQASGMSRFHFSRMFQQSTGRPPYAHLLHRRIVLAKALLLRSDASLTAIAAQCGFSNASQFSRMFKRETGATPTAFRNRR
ncbi:MAG: AraC family transcriptional regulator [Novosphingobium sp.]|nr:AraC family transcriptional regulator [Novosphingobium sp.]